MRLLPELQIVWLKYCFPLTYCFFEISFVTLTCFRKFNHNNVNVVIPVSDHAFVHGSLKVVLILIISWRAKRWHRTVVESDLTKTNAWLCGDTCPLFWRCPALVSVRSVLANFRWSIQQADLSKKIRVQHSKCDKFTSFSKKRYRGLVVRVCLDAIGGGHKSRHMGSHLQENSSRS